MFERSDINGGDHPKDVRKININSQKVGYLLFSR